MNFPVKSKIPSIFTKAFILVAGANFFYSLSHAYFFLLPLYIKSLGGDEAIIGIIMGSMGFCSMFMIPLMGVLMDRMWTKKGFFLVGAGLMAFISLAYLSLDSLFVPAFMLLRILQGASFALCLVSAGALMADILPKERMAQGLGYYGVFILVTHAIGPSIGELIVKAYGFKALFTLAFFFSILAFLAAMAIPGIGPERSTESSTSLFSLIRKRQMGIPILTTIIFGAGFGSVLVFIPTFMKSFGMSVGPFFIAYTMSAIGIRFTRADLSDVLGRRAVILPSLFAFALSIFGLSAFGLFSRVQTLGLPFLVGISALFGLSHGLLYPTMNALTFDVTDTKDRGKAMGLFSGGFNVGVTTSAIGLGLVAREWLSLIHISEPTRPY